MKKYNVESMVETLLNRLIKNEEICVWDFPNYDEHSITEIENILDIVDDCLEPNGYKVKRRKAPACGWGLANYAMIWLER